MNTRLTKMVLQLNCRGDERWSVWGYVLGSGGGTLADKCGTCSSFPPLGGTTDSKGGPIVITDDISSRWSNFSMAAVTTISTAALTMAVSSVSV